MHKSKRKWNCLDCGECTRLEHFYVRPDVWNLAHHSESGMLCVGCLEGRLGRRLVASDFTSAHINDPRRNAMTDRLKNRLMG